MASIATNRNGSRRILFVAPDGSRKTIRLGAVPLRTAESFRLRVEALLSARLAGVPVDAETARWLGGLPDRMYARLVRVGLADPRARAPEPTLGELLERFEASSAVKPSTWAAYRRAVRSLSGFFGPGRPLSSLTPADADKWRKSLVDEGLAPATVAKMVHVARSIFRRGVRWGVLPTSPFADLKAGPQHNPDRSFYVPREWMGPLLEACPSDEWRAIVALSRFAGLRCPSEIAGLRWGDVNWERGRLTVRSPKTTGHEGHAVRVVPIAPELRSVLLALFESAEPGAEAVIPRLAGPSGTSANLRTHFERIITRAGLKPWPRLFHNLRASCACDWSESYPYHVVASWMGHSPLIAARHYLATRDVHFDRAAGLVEVESVVQKSGAESGALGAQKAAQHTAAPDSTESRAEPQVLVGCDVAQPGATRCHRVRSEGMGATGLEHPRELSGNTAVSRSGGAKSGARSGDSRPHPSPARPTDPELAAVVAAWPDLPPALRADIVALVKAATPTTPPRRRAGRLAGLDAPDGASTDDT